MQLRDEAERMHGEVMDLLTDEELLTYLMTYESLQNIPTSLLALGGVTPALIASAVEQGLGTFDNHLYQNAKDGVSTNDAAVKASLASTWSSLQSLGKQQLENKIKDYIKKLLR